LSGKTTNGAKGTNVQTLHEIKTRDNHGDIQGRCVCCGKLAELAVLAEGFLSIGWCRQCEAENRQSTFELPAVQR
jgi:hypothetical protein